MSLLRRAGAAAALLLAAPQARADIVPAQPLIEISTAEFVSPSTAPYASVSGTVGEIRLHRTNVFDPAVPGEDWWPFRIANKIHILTREQVVRRELLLRPGDEWDPLKAIESERNLRAIGFIRRAEIKPAQTGRRKLDVDVHTQDSWTTAPQASIGTEGGEHFVILGIEESNLLGYGKSISAFHGRIGETARNELRYHDPRLGGSRTRLTSLYADSHRGDEVGVLLDQPFYSLSSDYAWSTLWAKIVQEDILYAGGEDFSKFNQDYRSFDLYAGAKVWSTPEWIKRVSGGWRYERSRFGATAETVAGTLPGDREMSGPQAGFELVQPNFIKETYINGMERVEDFNMGNELSVRGGPMLRDFGSDRDRWTFTGLNQKGIRFSEGRFALAQIGAEGRVRNDKLENAILFSNLNVYWKTTWLWPQTWVAHMEANASERLDGEKQLILGGNTGLRGYKNNAFTGARSFLMNFEDRFFLTREFFHLMRVGAVAFFDTGAIVGERKTVSTRDFKSDVGLGLRFSPSRSASGLVFRVDLAYALNQGPGPSRWVVSVRGGQAFSVFNSTNREALRSPASIIREESPGSRLRRR